MRYSIAIDGEKGSVRFPTMQRALDNVTQEMIRNARTVIVHDMEKRGYFTAFHCTISESAIAMIQSAPMTPDECIALEGVTA